MAVAPARACAFRTIRRVFEQGAFADRALHGEAAGLDARDRALATALVYGTVQRRATLDHLADAFSSRPVATLDPAVLAALRLGLLQLLFLDGIAPHAAVDDSVELAKRFSPGGAGLVNAVLRRTTREGRARLAELGEATPEQAAIRHSVPLWLAERWFAELGPEIARSLLGAINLPAESALRANSLRSTRAAVLQELGARARAASELPEGIVLDGGFDAFGSKLFTRGAIMPQSRASMLVARILAPQPGERVLDLCAAPGAKTTHLAALIEGTGEVVAVDRHRGRAAALERTCRRLGADGVVRVRVADAERPLDDGAFQRVLVDPPCSGLGTLQARPDLRWRASPERGAELASVQARILAAGAAQTAPGGTLVYSVCTISRAEGEGVLAGFLAAHTDWEAEDLTVPYPAWTSEPGARSLQLRPDRDGTDGFFIACLRRASAGAPAAVRGAQLFHAEQRFLEARAGIGPGRPLP